MRFTGSPTALTGWSLRKPQLRTNAGVKIKVIAIAKEEKNCTVDNRRYKNGSFRLCNRFGGRIPGGVSWWVIGSPGVSRKTRLGQSVHKCEAFTACCWERGRTEAEAPVTRGVDKKLPQRGRIYLFFHIVNNVVKTKKMVVANHCCGYLKDAFPSLSSGVCWSVRIIVLGFANKWELLFWLPDNFGSGISKSF